MVELVGGGSDINRATPSSFSVSVLLLALVERFGVSRLRDILGRGGGVSNREDLTSGRVSNSWNRLASYLCLPSFQNEGEGSGHPSTNKR